MLGLLLSLTAIGLLLQIWTAAPDQRSPAPIVAASPARAVAAAEDFSAPPPRPAAREKREQLVRADLPDFAEVEKRRADFAEVWARRRIEILRDRAGFGTEVIAALNRESASYIEKKRGILGEMDAALALSSPEIFLHLAAANRSYRESVRAIVGDPVFQLIEAERNAEADRYSFGEYSIPTDIF